MKRNHSLPLVISLLLVLVSASIQSQSPYQNIEIDRWTGEGYQPCEPSISIDPGNPAHLLAGAILDKVYLSSDSGRTWGVKQLTSELGVFGDPCTLISPSGNYHYFHLSNPSGRGWSDPSLLDQIVCQTSRDRGVSWNGGVGIGKNPPKDQDKEWASTDPKGKRIYVTWTEFDKYGSKAAHDSTYILFSRGNRKGTGWTKAKRINRIAGNCLDGSGTVEGAVPAGGRKKEVFVAWALNDTIWFDRSKNAGKTWLNDDRVAAIIPGGWAHNIPGIGRANGMPVTQVDRSGGTFEGRIYINWADQRNGADDTDIWLCWSDDQGDTWSEPVRVNDDGPGSQQFFTWMTVDQSNGSIHCVFYDRRNYDDLRTDVYLASSTDGGVTWTNERISQTPFIPTDKVFFGDYNNIAAHQGIVRPIWTRCDEGRLSIWTALIAK